jgi:integrase
MRRSATMPGYHRGRPRRNKGEQYPADPATVEEIVAVMRTVGDRADGHRLRALILLLWRAGLRISAALALQESDLDHTRGAILVRPREGRQAPRGRDGPLGVDPTRPMDGDPLPPSDRVAAVRDPRVHCRPALGTLSRP